MKRKMAPLRDQEDLNRIYDWFSAGLGAGIGKHTQ